MELIPWSRARRSEQEALKDPEDEICNLQSLLQSADEAENGG